MTYRIEIKPAAAKQIRKLPQDRLDPHRQKVITRQGKTGWMQKSKRLSRKTSKA